MYEMAWRMLDQPFSMPTHPPRQVWTPVPAAAPALASCLFQHDFDGNVIFQHRVGGTERWITCGESVRFPGFQFGARCLAALEELRGLWNGRVADVCRLTRGPNRTWRGQWLSYEQMPVELIPLVPLSPAWSPPATRHDGNDGSQAG